MDTITNTRCWRNRVMVAGIATLRESPARLSHTSISAKEVPGFDMELQEVGDNARALTAPATGRSPFWCREAMNGLNGGF